MNGHCSGPLKMSQGQEIGEIHEKNGKSIWIIKGFSTLSIGNPRAEPAFFFSPVFSTPTPISNTPRLNWQLKLYPSLITGEENNVSLYLVYKSEHEISCRISLFILNTKDEKVVKRRMKQPNIFNGNNQTWGFSKFVSRKDLMKKKFPMLIGDTLRIMWSITFINLTCHQDSDYLVQSHFKKLFDCGSFSDVTFVIGKQRLKLHKAILTALSPVFQAMFEHDMKENKESIVKITDIKYGIMQDMFRYIYLRQVYNINEKAGDLLIAAEKYSVMGLKMLCEQTLSSNLSLDNAIDNLKLAIVHNAVNLKLQANNFIISHLKTFVDREDFKQMDPSLKDEIFRAIAQKGG